LQLKKKKEMTDFQYFMIYVIGFLVTLILLHKFKKELGVDIYDPPHEGWYDDWNSNAQAYLAWSLGWPIFWVIGSLIFTWGLLMKLSNLINDSNKA
jgi:hypothetical protein